MWNPSNPTRRTATIIVIFVLPPFVWWSVFGIDWSLVERAFFKFPQRPGGNWIWVGLVIFSFLIEAIRKFWKLKRILGIWKALWPSARSGLFSGFIGFLFLFTVSIVMERNQTNKDYASVTTPCEMSKEAEETDKKKFPHQPEKRTKRDVCKAQDYPEIRNTVPSKADRSKNRRIEPKDNPDDLITQARATAKTVKTIHDQLEIDVQKVRGYRDDDKKFETEGLEGKAKEDRERYVDSIWTPQEDQIRDAAEANFRSCCQSKAISIRENIMLKCSGVSHYERNKLYENNDKIGFPITRRNLSEYSQIVGDLTALADALEKGCDK
jgi:hypothetical protein